MLPIRLAQHAASIRRLPTNNPVCAFAKTKHSSGSKFANGAASFQQMEDEAVKNYFQEYRKQVEKDTVIRDFRRQVFEKTNPEWGAENKEYLEAQEKHLDKLLSTGSKESITKFSKRIMEHYANKKKMFKNKQTKSTFRDYADYSAYKTNKVTIEDRNYRNMDNLDRNRDLEGAYQFIDSLPEQYEEKREVRNMMTNMFPFEAADMTISDFGRKMQQEHNTFKRNNLIIQEKAFENEFKITLDRSENILPTNETDQLKPKRQTYLEEEGEDIMETLSPEAMDSIYDLYLQGWTVREISRRYGILPARTKFYIWSRSKLYNEALPKFGLKYLMVAQQMQDRLLEQSTVVDYGLDLEDMTNTEKYEEVTVWTQWQTDAQRNPQTYAEALNKLEDRGVFEKYSMVQVGTDGVENKKHLLKEWKIHKGKKSELFRLRNKVFRNLLIRNLQPNKVYY